MLELGQNDLESDFRVMAQLDLKILLTQLTILKIIYAIGELSQYF